MKKTVENWGIPFGFAFLIALIFLMLGLSKTSDAQKRAWYRISYGSGKPTFKPNGTDPSQIAFAHVDSLSKKTWVFNKTNELWEESNFLKGELGQTGPQGPKGDKGDPGPQGPQGIPGAAGGSIIFPFTFPEKFGAVHNNQTFAQAGKDQAYINSNYPGIGAVTSDPIDWAAWQMCINDASATGKQIFAYGEYYINIKKILFPKYFGRITINGASCYLNVTGNDGSAVLGRPSPIDNGDANIMIQAFVDISGLEIGCTSGLQANRIGIDLGPTYNSSYFKVNCYSLQEAIHLRFALNTIVTMCEAQYCVKGWTSDIGNWPGAGNANSQSNHTSYTHCRFNAANNSDYAHAIYACSGNVIESGIIEGDKVRVGIDYDAQNSTVVKGIKIFNTHFECVNGASEAFIKAKMAGGILVVDNVFGQYAAVMVSATSTIGYPFVEVSHVAYWVPSPTAKYFVNAGCNWTLNYNDNFSSAITDWKGMFSGTQPNYCPVPGGGCGGDKYTGLTTTR